MQTRIQRIGYALAMAGIGAVLALPGTASAEEQNLTKQLQSMVSELSTDQQAALYLLLNEMTAEKPAKKAAKKAKAEGKKAAAEEGAASPEEALMAGISKIKEAAVNEDLDALMELIHEDFDYYQVGGKQDLREFIQNAIDMGYIKMYADSTEIITEDTEIEKEGDEVVIYPVEVEGAFGSATLEFVAKKSEDGKWRITTLEVYGI